MKITLFNACVSAGLIEEYYKAIGSNAPVPNVLTSYFYADGNISRLLEMQKNGKIGQFYLDSGAFSFKNGELVKNDFEAERFLDGYIGYLKLFGHKFDAHFTLDNNFKDPEHNLNYFLRINSSLVNSEKKTVPVLHAEGKAMLEEFKLYADMGCKHVAIGSNVKIKERKYWEEFQKIRAKKGIKIHLFGVIHEKDLSVLKMIMPDSCDSGKIFQVTKFGFLLYLKENPKTHTKSFDRIYIGGKETPPEKSLTFSQYIAKQENEDFKQYLESINVDHGKMLDNSTLTHVINLHQVCLYEAYLNEAIFNSDKKE